MSSDTPQKYGTLLTPAGKQAIAHAIATNSLVNIKYVCLGDGEGEEYLPTEAQTDLMHEVYHAEANSIYVDEENPNRIYVEMVIPETVGGFTIREAAIKTEDGTVIAIATNPAYYKPILAEGAATAIAYKFILEVTNASVVTLKIDPSLIYATVNFVKNSIENHSKQTNVHGGTYEKKAHRLMLRNEDGRCQVEEPKEPADAATKQYVDSHYGDLAISFEPKPHTLAFRNGEGRTQVADPVDDLDAVNNRTMRKFVHNNTGGKAVDTPVILAPEDGAVMQSLSFQVTVSEIRLLAGGVPQPAFTRYRVISSDEKQLLSYGEEPYTTTPTITVPDSHIGADIRVLVQHEDMMEGISAWSDHKPLKMAAVLAKQAAVTVPPRGAMNVLPNGLEVTVTAGAWSDDTPFAGEATLLEFYGATSNDLVYSTGWGEYATSFAIPDGTLAPSTNYWGRVRHRASAPPDTNPLAETTTPLVNRASEKATFFTTIGPMPPNTSGLTHTIPTVVGQGTQTAFTISGAISQDSGAITYSLVNIVGGTSFSKYENIVADEVIYMYAPTISETTQAASVNIVAKSSFGGVSASIAAPTTILGKTLWSYTTGGAKQFVAPETMFCDIYLGGGGGQDAGAGGGCAILRNYKLNKDQKYVFTVGAAGQDTSFYGATATAGGPGKRVHLGTSVPGKGVGGTSNYSGGSTQVLQSGVTNLYQYGGSGAGGAGVGNGKNGTYTVLGITPAVAAGGTFPFPAGTTRAASGGSWNGYHPGGQGSIGGGGGGGIAGSTNINGGSGSVYIEFKKGA